MSQLFLDEQINSPRVLPLIQKWIKAEYLRDRHPGEQVLDERVPPILLTLKQATFVTIDQGFWKRVLCHPDYCLLYFALRSNEQHLLPGMLRALLHLPEFHTRASRMGKVARVRKTAVDYWQFQKRMLQCIAWESASGGK